MEAILGTELDVSKITFGKPKQQQMGYVVNMFYKNGDANGYLKIQSPMMNTFGINYNDKFNKYAIGLSFYENSPDESFNQLNIQFRENMEKLEEKIIQDISNKYYKEWPIAGESWGNFPPEVRMAMVRSKLGKQTLIHKNTKDGKEYKTMNLKVNLDKDNNKFNVETFMLDDDKRIIIDQHGNNKLFDAREELFDLMEQNKIRPRIICLFQISIWLVNNNIYLSPVLNQVVIEKPKMMITKAVFNQRGIVRSEYNGDNININNNDRENDDNDNDNDNDDDDMPAPYNG
jgi:hypothetical protein